MKKLLILASTIIAGALATPAEAQIRSHSHGTSVQIFISGYHPCGTPIYSKRVHNGRHFSTQCLSGYELRHYLERQRRINAQRAIERRLINERYHRSRGHAHRGNQRLAWSRSRCR